MKQAIIGIILIGLLSCNFKNENKDLQPTKEHLEIAANLPQDSLPFLVANKAGIEQWKNITKVSFTFNVDANENHSERSWIWFPKTDSVVMTANDKQLKFNRKVLTNEEDINADKAFVNDIYWLLTPFKLVWDKGIKVEPIVKELSPIKQQLYQKLTIVYNDENGYTPGDAYDFYVNDDHVIQEWVYRKKNSDQASLTTTWENHTDINGITIAINHKKKDDNWNLYFTEVSFE